MAYTGERSLYDNDDICPELERVRNSTRNCFTAALPVCGDGRLDADESCDDGNVRDGDGCDASCAVECGYLCVQPSLANGVSTPSNCTQACGNGIVDVALGETCDTADSCCDPTTCTLVGDAACCGGECCTATGAALPTTSSCAAAAGYCAGGECIEKEEYCEQRGGVLDLSMCPIDPNSPCLPTCRDTTAGTCFASSAHDPTAPWSSLMDGAACERPAAGIVGECRAGECVPLPSCGDGVVGVGEECDDASACCDQTTCTLAPGASCSGECCPAPRCMPAASNHLAVACTAAGGFCYGGNCVAGDAQIWRNGQQYSFPTSGGVVVSPTLSLDTRVCPLVGNGCELRLVTTPYIASPSAFTEPGAQPLTSCFRPPAQSAATSMTLLSGTPCFLNASRAAHSEVPEGACHQGVCVVRPVCGDGVAQPGERCALAEASACGNGIVDVGEDCDGASACCNQATCRFATASTACAPAGSPSLSGYCAAGVCTAMPAIAGYEVDFAVCPVAGCNLLLKHSATSQCAALSQGVAEGAPCSLSDGASGSVRGLCFAGACIAESTCGNGVVEGAEECDDPTSFCCDRATCRLAPGAQCAAGECCDSATCRGRPSSTRCAAGGGLCAAGAHCLTSTSAARLGIAVDFAGVSFAPSACAPLDGCTLLFRDDSDGSCRPSGNALSRLPDGTACADGSPSSAVIGECRRGQCVVAPSCGDGVVGVGEECDDASACCDQDTCTLAPGAECSSGECCTDRCTFEPTSVQCGNEGFCSNGACTTALFGCTGLGMAVNTSACPIFADQPCQVRCARPADANGTIECANFLWNAADDAAHDLLPDGTRCIPSATDSTPGSCIAGVCIPYAGCAPMAGRPPTFPPSPPAPPWLPPTAPPPQSPPPAPPAHPEPSTLPPPEVPLNPLPPPSPRSPPLPSHPAPPTTPPPLPKAPSPPLPPPSPPSLPPPSNPPPPTPFPPPSPQVQVELRGDPKVWLHRRYWWWFALFPVPTCLPVLPPPPPPPSAPPAPPLLCFSLCETLGRAWEFKCESRQCEGCIECKQGTTAPPQPPSAPAPLCLPEPNLTRLEHQSVSAYLTTPPADSGLNMTRVDELRTCESTLGAQLETTLLESTFATSEPVTFLGALCLLACGLLLLFAPPVELPHRLCFAAGSFSTCSTHVTPEPRYCSDWVGGLLVVGIGGTMAVYHSLGVPLYWHLAMLLRWLYLCWFVEVWSRRVLLLVGSKCTALLRLLLVAGTPVAQICMMRLYLTNYVADLPEGDISVGMLPWIAPVTYLLLLSPLHVCFAPRRKLQLFGAAVLLGCEGVLSAVDLSSCDSTYRALNYPLGTLSIAHAIAGCAFCLLAFTAQVRRRRRDESDLEDEFDDVGDDEVDPLELAFEDVDDGTLAQQRDDPAVEFRAEPNAGGRALRDELTRRWKDHKSGATDGEDGFGRRSVSMDRFGNSAPTNLPLASRLPAPQSLARPPPPTLAARRGSMQSNSVMTI